MNVLIVGASRGLGLEFVRQYRAAGARITATARDDSALVRLGEYGVKGIKLDVADAASVSGLAWQIDGERFDVVVINAGVYGPDTRGLETPTQADFDAVMHTNVLGPMRVLPQIAEALAPGARVAILSSKMGSIALRASTSGWLYRASKAAVNSVMKDAALTLAGKATVISFHPGWVRTDMGGSGADIDASTSIAGMRTVLASVKPSDTGSFFNYDGQRLAW
ncbi:MAG: SDR family oxidoreductase [Burkholderiales bacterium]|jgi:NAD(P)-dependent dehydrogenase (short-subunit alcohol dehydrogenase family)|nr:SDR family oxidoreductase [Burkholderiales bacterium]